MRKIVAPVTVATWALLSWFFVELFNDIFFGWVAELLGSLFGKWEPVVVNTIAQYTSYLFPIAVAGVLVGGVFYIGRRFERHSQGSAVQLEKDEHGVFWDFTGFFLGLEGASGSDEASIHVNTFQARGQNKTERLIRAVSGEIILQSGHTLPMFMNVGGHLVAPNNTNGIPANAEFFVAVPFSGDPAIEARIGENMFLRDYGGFTFRFEGDGKVYERKFSRDEIKAQIEVFRDETFPPIKPTVTKR